MQANVDFVAAQRCHESMARKVVWSEQPLRMLQVGCRTQAHDGGTEQDKRGLGIPRFVGRWRLLKFVAVVAIDRTCGLGGLG